ncbi:MAG: carboxypeptidase-like regulatory domain-containing protein, partial [Calditrichota bacterium]
VNYQDLNPAVRGDIWFWTDDEMAVITWVEVAHWIDQNGQGPFWTFQLIINARGLIKYQYAVIGAYDNADFMIGLQNEARDLGFTVIIDGNWDYLQEERVIAFGPPDAWVTWLDAEPSAGDVAGGEDADIDVTFNLEGLEAGVYFAQLSFELDNDLPRIQIPVVLSYESAVGSIEGTISDAANNNPMEGVLIHVEPSGIERVSDGEGLFAVENLPVGEYTLTYDFAGYIPAEQNVQVAEDETSDGSFDLLHAEFNPSVQRLITQMGPDQQDELNFTASNDGNAPLAFTAFKRLQGEANAEPWELRQQYMISEITGDPRISGVAFFDDHFYVTGHAAGAHLIYVLDREGNITDRINQLGQSQYGMQDLAWDGEWLWGSGERRIFGFTPDGQQQVVFDGLFNPMVNVAWDSDRNILWASGNTTDIVG